MRLPLFAHEGRTDLMRCQVKRQRRFLGEAESPVKGKYVRGSPSLCEHSLHGPDP
jgi:hypothetical protein